MARLPRMDITNMTDPRHGTVTGYSYGCRCDTCKAARSVQSHRAYLVKTGRPTVARQGPNAMPLQENGFTDGIPLAPARAEATTKPYRAQQDAADGITAAVRLLAREARVGDSLRGAHDLLRRELPHVDLYLEDGVLHLTAAYDTGRLIYNLRTGKARRIRN